MNGTAEVFREASRVMAEQGQCKGDLRDESGRVCLLGALLAAEALANYQCDDTWLIANDLARVYVPEFAALVPSWKSVAPAWNDADERTQTEVEKFLLWAADRIDADEAGA